MDQYQRLIIIYNDTHLFIWPDASDFPVCVRERTPHVVDVHLRDPVWASCISVDATSPVPLHGLFRLVRSY